MEKIFVKSSTSLNSAESVIKGREKNSDVNVFFQKILSGKIFSPPANVEVRVMVRVRIRVIVFAQFRF